MKTFAEAFFYGIQVEILGLVDIEAEKVKYRGTPPNRQYSAPQILAILNKRKPHNAFAVMGICASDIYHREEWNYVFGLASLIDHVKLQLNLQEKSTLFSAKERNNTIIEPLKFKKYFLLSLKFCFFNIEKGWSFQLCEVLVEFL